MHTERDLADEIAQTPWIVEKLRTRKSYAQNLYAAFCNMRWQPVDVFPILKDEYWSCSWRSSGGIIAELLGEGDYLDWYCSGIGGGFNYDDVIHEGYVGEGFVTEEIQEDLAKLGWAPSPWPDDE